MDTITQRRTSAAATGINKPAGAMNSAFDTAAGNKPRRALPPLALTTLRAEKAGPPPNTGGGRKKGLTRHDALFDLLTEDGMCVRGIPRAYYGSLGKAAQAYLKQRPKLAAKSRLLVRSIDGNHIGVWRVAKEGAPS